ncbi:Glutathione synthase/RimK-type ligase, ATP-grasp superfamily [Bradyrhizobium sp. Rc2d]|nr:Glutathione synthase/RimK-type ligase, ATP-grasp superfamily [Bradyrhizobium sp. Rc2d]
MGGEMTLRVLLAHSVLWPNVARLAMAFRKAGFDVDVVALAGHPIHRMHSPNRTFEYRPMSPYSSVKEAIAASQPDLIVPCDDRVVGHLHRLYKETSAVGSRPEMQRTASLIETSLGSPLSYHVVAKRSFLTNLAQLPDVHIPQTSAIYGFRDLLDWVRRHGLPAVLKLDGSTGGRDVILIRTMSDVLPCLLRMRLQKSWVRRMKSFLFDGDVEPIFAPRSFSTAQMCVQSYVTGRLANCVVACWRGDVLGWAAVEVLQRGRDFGIATVVRRVKGEAMIAAARSIARHLKLSGIVGFDFVLDDVTQRANLIEINPRATQINHFPGYDSPDLATALFCAVRSEPVVSTASQQWKEEVALFPQEWERDPSSKWLSTAFHDVPFEEPELVRYFGYETISRDLHLNCSERAPPGAVPPHLDLFKPGSGT